MILNVRGSFSLAVSDLANVQEFWLHLWDIMKTPGNLQSTPSSLYDDWLKSQTFKHHDKELVRSTIYNELKSFKEMPTEEYILWQKWEEVNNVYPMQESVLFGEPAYMNGNHDCNMNNSDRLDVLTPIVEALNLPNFHYLKDTGVFWLDGVAFSVFSIFDNKDSWIMADDFSLSSARKKIALFHGPVDHSQTDVGYVVSSRHFTTDMFDGYDLALLGDIHKRQELISPKGCKCVYAGSLVQQNFGETLDKHGFLVWDLETLTYEEVDIKNDYGYYTMDIIAGVVPDVTDLPLYPRLRVRFADTDAADTKRAITEIKVKYGVDDFTTIRTDSLAKKKTGDRDNKLELEDITDITYQNSLITDYIQRMMPFVTDEEIAGIQSLNKEINGRIELDELTRNVKWKPVRFEFSNMFSYGEDNVINFDKVNGLMGLFAPNASGKSSLFDAISFCLFDKCSRAFKAAHIMNNRKSDFHCQLDFEVEGVGYHIRREARTINKGRNVKVDVQFWRDGDSGKEILNGTERRDTNQVIEGYVGRYEDFVLTALSLQGNNALFIDKSQSERKDLLPSSFFSFYHKDQASSSS